jgi:hypothetical protein
LAHLAGLPNLTWLYLGGDKITDKGMVHVGRLVKLTGLEVSRTRVTDAGLLHLYGLKDLSSLLINARLVSKTATDDMEAALPQVSEVTAYHYE